MAWRRLFLPRAGGRAGNRQVWCPAIVVTIPVTLVVIPGYMMLIRDILVYFESENVEVKEGAGTYRRDVTNHLIQCRICDSYIGGNVFRYRIPPVCCNEVV